MDLPSATITFECGAEARNVGVVSMAVAAHVGQCGDPQCQEEVANYG